MDIITHAAVGGALGYTCGYPLTGAAVAIVPDLVLGVKRKIAPTAQYNLTHSFVFVLAAMCIALFAAVLLKANVFLLPLAVVLALVSHILLDAYTHSEQWAPTILYPYNKHQLIIGPGIEWEFFNDAWFNGANVALIVIIICLLVGLLCK